MLQEEVGSKVSLADDGTVETIVPDETRRHIDAGKPFGNISVKRTFEQGVNFIHPN